MTEQKKCGFVPCLYIKEGKAVAGFDSKDLFAGGDAAALAGYYSENDADGLLVFDLSVGDEEHDIFISLLRRICEVSHCPVLAAGNVRRLEDVKKALYAGAAKVALNFSRQGNIDLIEEAAGRFGKEKIFASVASAAEYLENRKKIALYGGGVLCLEGKGHEAGKALELVEELGILSEVQVVLHTLSEDQERIRKILKTRMLDGLSGSFISSREVSIRAFRAECLREGIEAACMTGAIPFEEFKLGADGLIPVVAQDYRTDEVLMVAYMNKEAYEKTLETGKMTYYSRSRKELWIKGLTSGHYQYVKSLAIDCDRDTILAKVDQVGAACHTGNRSCFFTPLAAKESNDKNPLRVFQEVYDVIRDRKVHPKEGSYTNYLFDKGIDKILKKVGEEATEIVIAAKNPDKEETTYELSDFLYHAMVLMAEKGISWEEVTRELARR